MEKKIIKVKLVYFHNEYLATIKEEDNITNILINYSKMMNKEIKDLDFFYKGKKLKFDKKLKLNELNNSSIIIFVINSNLKYQTISESKQIICPSCRNLALLNIKNEKIITNNCINRHNPIMDLDKFISEENFDESNIKCECDCKCNNLKKYYQNDFYRCSCNKTICPLCINDHIKNIKDINDINNEKHELSKYYDYLYRCYSHNIPFDSYCNDCHKNLCSVCEMKCRNRKHNIKYLKSIKPNEKKINIIKDYITEGKKKILKYIKSLERLKISLNNNINDLIKNLNNFSQLLDKIFFSIENLFNYENIQIANNYESFKIEKYINQALKEKIKKNLKIQIDLFDIKNRMSMIYRNVGVEQRINLFGDEFAKKIKKQCVLVINDEIKDFFHHYIFDQKKNETSVKVELFGSDGINNMSSTFNNCSALFSLDVSQWDISNVTDLSHMFRSCINLQSITGLNQWNTKNVSNMSDLFFECSNLKEMPDISNWKTSKVTNMCNMFKGCKNLKCLPDISNWDTKQVTNMSNIFSDCKSLYDLPDISKWNIDKVTNLSRMFNCCESIKAFPDISIWKTSNVSNMDFMFCECKSLNNLPDISKWDTSKVIDFQQIFFQCSELKQLPKIEETWIINQKSNISNMFFGCTKLNPNFSYYQEKFNSKKNNKNPLI